MLAQISCICIYNSYLATTVNKLFYYYYYYYYHYINFFSKIITLKSKIQKGFTSKISGTLEHTSQMASVINKARIRQRYLIITLLDLKNAFGEVHHNLIFEVLKVSSYTLPSKEPYKNHFPVQLSVSPCWSWGFQGDCLSPLLLNLCLNTSIQHIKEEKCS